MGSYNKGFLQPGVLEAVVLEPGFLTNSGSYNEWFLQPGVLTTRGL